MGVTEASPYLLESFSSGNEGLEYLPSKDISSQLLFYKLSGVSDPEAYCGLPRPCLIGLLIGEFPTLESTGDHTCLGWGLMLSFLCTLFTVGGAADPGGGHKCSHRCHAARDCDSGNRSVREWLLNPRGPAPHSAGEDVALTGGPASGALAVVDPKKMIT